MIPRTVVDDLDTTREGRGLRWLGWEPSHTGAWMLWRTGNRPLEFEGIALTPRFCDYDEVPPFDRFDDICRRLDHHAPDHCSFCIRWPDHDVAREELALTCGNLYVDALVVRAAGGQFVLGWTEEAAGLPAPPAGEVREPYPSRDDRGREPYSFHYEDAADIRFRVEVFDTAEALRTWVESAGEGRLTPTSTRLVRWAVDVASEFEPALDVPATSERLPEPDAGQAPGKPKLSTCSVCGETRPLLEFYDDVHKVFMLDGEPWVYIDHGEAAALIPPRDADVRRQAAVLERRLARAGVEYEWFFAFDLDVEEACCGADDRWTLAQHIIDHHPQPLINVSACTDAWVLEPNVAPPGDDSVFEKHPRLEAELVDRCYPIRSGGMSWDLRWFDDPGSCSSALLALLEGAGIDLVLLVRRADGGYGDVVEMILPD